MKKKFNTQATSLSKVNALYLAHCSQLVYKSKADIQEQLTTVGFELSDDKFFISSKKDTQCFVVGDRQKIIIAFRGSERKIADWATNAKAVMTKWTKDKDDGEVHRGFNAALKSVWPGVTAEIRRLRDANQSIWITGHSLGGALATLAAARLQLEEKIPVSGLYTFGQPRIGDNDFAKVFNKKLKKRSFRFVNNNDVVTRVPPQVFGYSHIGKLMYFDAKGKLQSDKKLSWWGGFWDRLEGRYRDVFDLDPDGIGDHSMDEYLRLVKKAQKKK